ncbi:MAG: ferritin-like domain-containing protein [Actinomycetota bacterium]|nr:ferritin-like domain-containing protein [Actinomycetota bacterium]
MELDFDLDRYLRASKKVDLSDLAWDRIADHPVSVAEARCLAYMMDIESHTVIFLRDLLATRAAFEPDITAFLSCWVYEELWHGEAFSRFLGEAGFALGDEERTRWDDPYPSRVGRNSWIRRKMGAKGYFAHIGTLFGSAFVRDFPALHMAWGALNEYSTLTGYHRLIAKTDHPVMIDLLTRVIKDERRHYAFYRNQARLRLERSAKARRVTRWALEHAWAPVGTGVRPQAETDFVVAYLMGDVDGLKVAAEMDAAFSTLPGLEGTRLVQDATREAVERLGAAQLLPSRTIDLADAVVPTSPSETKEMSSASAG